MSVNLAPTIEGTVLNYRYQVEHVFNDKGGMGLIYQATDMNLRSTVVLKKSRFVDEQSRAAFEREARLLYGLRHNALPRVIDYFITEDSSQFFVMEFIPGQDLSEMLSDRIERGEGPFPITQVLDWGDQLLDALHYLHMHDPPIIHRDIKPQNLKLMPNGQIILLDFGLAKGAVSGMTLSSASIQGYTPNYAPLEQMRGSGTDARSDIYSLAVTMHCLLSGQMPPDAVSRAIETLSAQPDPLRPLHEINPSFPIPVSDALQRACSLNQNERPLTAQAMREVLRQARAKLSRIDSQILSELKFDTNPDLQPTPSHMVSVDSPKSEVLPALEIQPVMAKSQRAQAASITSAPSVSDKTPTVAPEPSRKFHAVSAVVEQAARANDLPLQPPQPDIDAVAAFSTKAEATPAAKEMLAATSDRKAYDASEDQSLQAPEEVEPGRQQFNTVSGFPAETEEAKEERQRFDTIVELRLQEPAMAEPERNGIGTTAPVPAADARAETTTNETASALAVSVPTPVVIRQGEKSVNEVPAKPSEYLRPTSLFVIEHKDDGVRMLEPEGVVAAGRNERRVAKLVHEAKPAPPATPEPANAKGAQNNPRQNIVKQNRRAFPPDQPASLRRDDPLAHEITKPSQGDVLPNIDLTGVIATPSPTAITPKGMRSYTEVIALNVRMEMHAIPGGEFLMGSPEKLGYADEYPQHRATLSPFYIGKYPITQAQWRAVMRTNSSHFNGPNHPVDSITWDEAFEFCRRLSYATNRTYRLPTEAEWEFACRAGMQTQFNYGDEEEFIVQYAWCLTNSGNHTHPVGEKKPNGWGLYDMHGNVWEWCQDWYAADYYQHSPSVNPSGPAKGASRVLRGGSWYSLPNYCRNAGRSNHQPDLRDPLVGFRVVCEARNA